MQAGKNVFTLFRNRGWEAIIADNLIGNTLMLVSLVVGGVMGGLGLLMAAATPLLDDAEGSKYIVAFIFGFVAGFVICSILLSTVGSAVNAIIVLFAEMPAEFQQNHPALSDRMRTVWSQTYPGSV